MLTQEMLLHYLGSVVRLQYTVVNTQSVWSQMRLECIVHDSRLDKGAQLSGLTVLDIDQEQFVEEGQLSN